MNTSTLQRIPHHLRQYVIQQNYDAYDEVDQAVWRFVLLQTYHRLKELAHPAFTDGLKQTGISVSHIPRIEEMDACLSQFGWGAVCVDGFIPPRAFQEFQALGIMTIAADIRTPEHLAYTPAPDIIHESAGHSPIVPDPKYRRFLKSFGEIGCRAFSSPQDQRVYEAIRQLSIVKESPESSLQTVQAAEHELNDAVKSISWASETALLSRLHWWTVEYGLIGTPSDYRIYGAGLLSSVGESFFCHQPHIKKIPLTPDCIHTSYDITKPQPQLFVVRDFDALNEVLEIVADTLAIRIGGAYALDMAIKSEEVATVETNSGIQITGILSQYQQDEKGPVYLQFQGPSCLSHGNQTLTGHSRDYHEQGYGCAIGCLEGDIRLSTYKEDAFLKWTGKRLDDRIVLRYQSGIVVNGRLCRIACDQAGFLQILTFKDCTVTRGDLVLFQPDWGFYDLAISESVITAYAGVADLSYWPATELKDKKVPSFSPMDPQNQRLHEMYRQALRTIKSADTEEILALFRSLHEELQSHYPEHWLLRWNLLETLVKMDRGVILTAQLKKELLEIESRHYEEAPISMGLKYLGLL